MRALLVGDVHGEIASLLTLIEEARSKVNIDAAFQVGDFGLFPELIGKRGELLPEFPVPVHVACGNHEDHAWLQRCLRNEHDRAWVDHNLYYQPRGSVLQFGGSTIGFLGGALNVDQPQRGRRRKGTTNYIIDEQRMAAAAVFAHSKPELLVTHSCPANIGIGMRGNPALAMELREHVINRGFDPGPEHDAGEAELTYLWKELDPRPTAWVFGHFHYRHRKVIDDCNFACVGMVTEQLSYLIWDSDRKCLLDLD